MHAGNQQIYGFDNFRLDVSNRQLLSDGKTVALPAKAFDMLIVLIENAGRLVGKDELFRRVWPDQIVEESNLTVQVSAIRKALGERTNNPRYLLTVPGHGYRFVGNVTNLEEETAEISIERHSVSRVMVETENAASADENALNKEFAEGNIGHLPARDGTEVSNRNRVTGWRTFLFAGLIVLVISFGLVLVLNRTRLPIRSPATASIKSIAVLPFKPLVVDSRDESLELGIADTLITRLGHLKQVMVRPTSAVRGYTGLDQDPIAAGREQRVDAVLDGSIQKSGERIRVTVRLMNVADGQQIWSDKFDEKFTDIFVVQDSISRQVAEAIVNLTGREKETLASRYTENFEAYQLYLKGRYFWNKVTEESLKKSVECFNQAIEKDQNYALAYAGLADSYILASFFGMSPPAESYGKAKTAATRALEIDNKLAEAHATMALIFIWYEWDWSSGEAEFKRALELSPNYGTAHQGYGRALAMVGRFDEGLAELKRAQELDPLSLIIDEEIGTAFLFARKYDEAINQVRKTLDMDARFAFAYIDLSIALEQTGKPQEAITELQKALKLEKENAFVLSLMGFTYARMGGKAKAEDIIRQLKELSRRKYVSPVHMARINVGLGNTEHAFELLEQGYQARDYNMPYLRADPTFESLRLDPRFSALVRRLGLP
jgi:DNA-binding winged helix-turn-helix (wHTH) protein/TolB-like protein/Flp pilus assembly protein TadD